MERYQSSDPLFVDKFIRSIYDLTSEAANEEETLTVPVKAVSRLKQLSIATITAPWSLYPILQTLQKHLLSPDFQATSTSAMTLSSSNTVVLNDESTIMNTHGDKISVPECVKVLGIKQRPIDDQLVDNLSTLLSIISEKRLTKRTSQPRFMTHWNFCLRWWSTSRLCSRTFVPQGWTGMNPWLGSCWWSGSVFRLVCASLCHCSLIGFCDASRRAYAAVVFLKIRTADDCTAQFVVSRTTVAPLTVQSIPCWSWWPHFLLSRLLSSVTQALMPEQVLDKPQCYKDSKIVLYWVRGVEKEWKHVGC